MAADAGVEMKGDGGHGDVRGPGRQATGSGERTRRGAEERTGVGTDGRTEVGGDEGLRWGPKAKGQRLKATE